MTLNISVQLVIPPGTWTTAKGEECYFLPRFPWKFSPDCCFGMWQQDGKVFIQSGPDEPLSEPKQLIRISPGYRLYEILKRIDTPEERVGDAQKVWEYLFDEYLDEE